MGLSDREKAAVLCCVSLAKVSSLGAHVAHDKHSDPFGAVFFIISVSFVIYFFSTQWKVLKTAK